MKRRAGWAYSMANSDTTVPWLTMLGRQTSGPNTKHRVRVAVRSWQSLKLRCAPRVPRAVNWRFSIFRPFTHLSIALPLPLPHPLPPALLRRFWQTTRLFVWPEESPRSSATSLSQCSRCDHQACRDGASKHNRCLASRHAACAGQPNTPGRQIFAP
jgi:hypothetical protein